jgi:hypothetical protein
MKDLKIRQGLKPILITASHVFKHKRPTLKNTDWKLGEPCTDYIARKISENIDGFCICSNKPLEYDPNFHLLNKNPFKQKIVSLQKQFKFSLFLDIHGLSDKHQYDLGIFYVNRFGRSKRLAYDLSRFLNEGSLKDSLIQVLLFNDNIPQETLAEFTTKILKIPSVQIEVARYIRDDQELRDLLITYISDFLSVYL